MAQAVRRGTTPERRLATLFALERLGAPALAQMVALARSGQPDVRERAAIMVHNAALDGGFDLPAFTVRARLREWHLSDDPPEWTLASAATGPG